MDSRQKPERPAPPKTPAKVVDHHGYEIRKPKKTYGFVVPK